MECRKCLEWVAWKDIKIGLCLKCQDKMLKPIKQTEKDNEYGRNF